LIELDRRIVNLILILITISVVLLVIIYPPRVTVKGSVTSLKADFTPNRILFKGSDGHEYLAEIIGGTYSIVLPNHQSYKVNVFFFGYRGDPPYVWVDQNYMDMGIFSLDTRIPDYVKDWLIKSDQIPTPQPS
jgi:hypothetical protein